MPRYNVTFKVVKFVDIYVDAESLDDAKAKALQVPESNAMNSWTLDKDIVEVKELPPIASLEPLAAKRS